MKIVDFYSNSEFTLDPERLDKYSHVHTRLDEEFDSILSDDNDISYSVSKGNIEKRADLSSFKPQKELNQDIWNGDILKSEIRLKLLDIADDFYDSLEVNWVKPKDIILTGSLANYNWSKYSDYDLHILIDFNEVDERTDFVKDYFDSKKNEWNNEHENLKLRHFPVEVYVQDINETLDASGIYSLEKNKWIQKPEENSIKAIKLDKYWIKEKSLKIMYKIDTLYEKAQLINDKHKLEIISKKIDNLSDFLKDLRSESLKNGGEMSSGNIVYKLLRRMGYLDKLWDLKDSVYDKINSI